MQVVPHQRGVRGRRPLRQPADRDQLLRQRPAGRGVRRCRRHGHGDEADDARRGPARGHPDPRRLPDRHRRRRRLAPGQARPPRLRALPVRRAAAAAGRRASGQAGLGRRHHPRALRGARQEPLHRRLPRADGPDRVRLRALRRHRQVPDHGQRRRWSTPRARSALDGTNHNVQRRPRAESACWPRARRSPAASPPSGCASPSSATRREADRASLDAVTAAFTKGDAVTDLLVGLAGSRTFRYRSPNAGEKLP